MLDNNTKKALDELISKIFQGNVALFLGAGVSHAAGGACWGQAHRNDKS